MFARKPAEKPATALQDALIRAISAKARTLKERDSTLLISQLELEGQGARPIGRPAQPADHELLAAQLLDGITPPAPMLESDGARLNAIQTERRAISLALATLARHEAAARAAAAVETMAIRQDDWIELARNRAFAAVALQRANIACSQFRSKVSRIAGTSPGLTCDRDGGIFAVPVVGDQIYSYI